MRPGPRRSWSQGRWELAGTPIGRAASWGRISRAGGRARRRLLCSLPGVFGPASGESGAAPCAQPTPGAPSRPPQGHRRCRTGRMAPGSWNPHSLVRRATAVCQQLRYQPPRGNFLAILARCAVANDALATLVPRRGSNLGYREPRRPPQDEEPVRAGAGGDVPQGGGEGSGRQTAGGYPRDGCGSRRLACRGGRIWSGAARHV